MRCVIITLVKYFQSMLVTSAIFVASCSVLFALYVSTIQQRAVVVVPTATTSDSSLSRISLPPQMTKEQFDVMRENTEAKQAKEEEKRMHSYVTATTSSGWLISDQLRRELPVIRGTANLLLVSAVPARGDGNDPTIPPSNDISLSFHGKATLSGVMTYVPDDWFAHYCITLSSSSLDQLPRVSDLHLFSHVCFSDTQTDRLFLQSNIHEVQHIDVLIDILSATMSEVGEGGGAYAHILGFTIP